MRRFIEYLQENFFAERERWIACVPVLFGTGIGIYFLLGHEPSKWLTVLLVEALLFMAYIWRYFPERLLLLTAVFIATMGFSDIQLRALYQAKHIENPKQNEVTYLKGRIVTIGHNAKGKVRLLLTAAEDFEQPRKGLFRVTLSSKTTNLQEGQCVEMIATLMRPTPPVLPGGYQFDRKAFFEGLSAVGYANSTVFAVDCASTPGLWEKLGYAVTKLRHKVVKRINAELPRDEAGIVSAIVAGERGGISQKLTNQYRDSGLAHFLSISGLHMSMIAAMAFFVVRLLISLVPYLALRFDSKKAAAVFALFMSFIYLLISGAQIPSQRAFITTFVVLLGVLFSRQAISMRMVSFAALVVLVISPQALISASFQMSFAAVVVLIAFYERFAAPIHRFFAGKGIIRIIIAYIAGLLISDLVASLATLPFAIYHFNRIAVFTTLGNLLAGPVIGLLIMPFVLLALFLMPFGLDVLPLKIVGYGVMLVNRITAYVSALPGAGYQVMSMPFWGLLLIVLGGLWLCIWQRRWRLWGIVPLLAGILSFLVVQKPDALYDASGEAIAVQDNSRSLVTMPGRCNNWAKQIWLEKTVSLPIDKAEKKDLSKIYSGDKVNTDWLSLQCDEETCVYKDVFRWYKDGSKVILNGMPRQAEDDLGGAVFITQGKADVRTVREDIGFRLWNGLKP